MKDLAQVAYETFSRSFEIDVPHRAGRVVPQQGPIAWQHLPELHKNRWKQVARALVHAAHDNALEAAKAVALEARRRG